MSTRATVCFLGPPSSCVLEKCKHQCSFLAKDRAQIKVVWDKEKFWTYERESNRKLVIVNSMNVSSISNGPLCVYDVSLGHGEHEVPSSIHYYYVRHKMPAFERRITFFLYDWRLRTYLLTTAPEYNPFRNKSLKTFVLLLECCKSFSHFVERTIHLQVAY